MLGDPMLCDRFHPAARAALGAALLAAAACSYPRYEFPRLPPTDELAAQDVALPWEARGAGAVDVDLRPGDFARFALRLEGPDGPLEQLDIEITACGVERPVEVAAGGRALFGSSYRAVLCQITVAPTGAPDDRRSTYLHLPSELARLGLDGALAPTVVEGPGALADAADPAAELQRRRSLAMLAGLFAISEHPQLWAVAERMQFLPGTLDLGLAALGAGQLPALDPLRLFEIALGTVRVDEAAISYLGGRRWRLPVVIALGHLQLLSADVETFRPARGHGPSLGLRRLRLKSPRRPELSLELRLVESGRDQRDRLRWPGCGSATARIVGDSDDRAVVQEPTGLLSWGRTRGVRARLGLGDTWAIGLLGPGLRVEPGAAMLGADWALAAPATDEPDAGESGLCQVHSLRSVALCDLATLAPDDRATWRAADLDAGVGVAVVERATGDGETCVLRLDHEDGPSVLARLPMPLDGAAVGPRGAFVAGVTRGVGVLWELDDDSAREVWRGPAQSLRAVAGVDDLAVVVRADDAALLRRGGDGQWVESALSWPAVAADCSWPAPAPAGWLLRFDPARARLCRVDVRAAQPAVEELDAEQIAVAATGSALAVARAGRLWLLAPELPAAVELDLPALGEPCIARRDDWVAVSTGRGDEAQLGVWTIAPAGITPTLRADGAVLLPAVSSAALVAARDAAGDLALWQRRGAAWHGPIAVPLAVDDALLTAGGVADDASEAWLAAGARDGSAWTLLRVGAAGDALALRLRAPRERAFGPSRFALGGRLWSVERRDGSGLTLDLDRLGELLELRAQGRVADPVWAEALRDAGLDAELTALPVPAASSG
ncbi:MAG: hypothetical protein IPM29_04320 [Planctomycetes bacterium]|nr:hypothetical protein [Planctomycetota bacterium]